MVTPGGMVTSMSGVWPDIYRTLSLLLVTLLVNVTRENGRDIVACPFSPAVSCRSPAIELVPYLPHTSARGANTKDPTRPPSGYKAMTTNKRKKIMFSPRLNWLLFVSVAL